MSYDGKCAELARHFLSDFQCDPEQEVDALAQEIQDAIEWWLEWRGLRERTHQPEFDPARNSGNGTA